MGILRDVLAKIIAITGQNIHDRYKPDVPADWLVASYKDKEDFAYLWSEDFLKWVKSGAKRNVVVVWDGVPDADGRFEYITPVYWALGLSHCLLQGKKGVDKAIPELRIFLCDASQRNKGSAFSKALPDICAGMPWLRIYRPTGTANDYWKCFECLIEDIKNAGATFPALDDAGKERVASLVCLLIGSITRDGLEYISGYLSHDCSGLRLCYVMDAVDVCESASRTNAQLSCVDDLKEIITELFPFAEKLRGSLATFDRNIASLKEVCSADVLGQLCAHRDKLLAAEKGLTSVVENFVVWMESGLDQGKVEQLAITGTEVHLVFKSAGSLLDIPPDGSADIVFPQKVFF